MPSYLNDLLDRVAAHEVLATAPLVEASAKPFFIYQQPTFPYFTNRIESISLDLRSPQDIETREISVTMRLVVQHVNAGYEGDYERLLYELIPLVEAHFGDARWLLDDAGSNADTMKPIGAQLTRSRGLAIFQNAGVEAQQIGTEFTLTVQFEFDRYGEV
jgi:hypothetical protein